MGVIIWAATIHQNGNVLISVFHFLEFIG